jgi:hypothetical protein
MKSIITNVLECHNLLHVVSFLIYLLGQLCKLKFIANTLKTNRAFLAFDERPFWINFIFMSNVFFWKFPQNLQRIRRTGRTVVNLHSQKKSIKLPQNQIINLASIIDWFARYHKL